MVISYVTSEKKPSRQETASHRTAITSEEFTTRKKKSGEEKMSTSRRQIRTLSNAQLAFLVTLSLISLPFREELYSVRNQLNCCEDQLTVNSVKLTSAQDKCSQLEATLTSRAKLDKPH